MRWFEALRRRRRRPEARPPRPTTEGLCALVEVEIVTLALKRDLAEALQAALGALQPTPPFGSAAPDRAARLAALAQLADGRRSLADPDREARFGHWREAWARPPPRVEARPERHDTALPPAPERSA